MSGSIWRPRIVVDITPELYNRLQAALPWGTKNAVFVEVTEQLVSAIEKGGQVVSYLILNRKLPMFKAPREEVKGVLDNGPEGIS